MEKEQLFGMALGLEDPWTLDDVKYEDREGRLVLMIDVGFKRGWKFRSSDGTEAAAYDTRERTWRHMNFFQFECYLRCKVPRVKKGSGGIETIEVPWSRPQSGFTLLFEQVIMSLISKEMTVSAVSKLLRETSPRLWRVFNHYVGIGKSTIDCSDLTELGIDETSIKKGHKYVTVAVDMEKRTVVGVSQGKDKSAIVSIKGQLEARDCPSHQVEQLSMDMSRSFIAGGLEAFENAQITFDKFHVKKLLNEAMDKVRKQERREHEILKGHKYTFMKSESKLSARMIEQRDMLTTMLPRLGEAYRLKVLFDDLWSMETAEQADIFLDQWIAEVDKADLTPFQNFANTIRNHWYGITQYFKSGLTNAVLESINAKIQLAKKRARGYRNIKNMINMIFFIAGDIHAYPLKTS